MNNAEPAGARTEAQIAEWRAYIARHAEVSPEDAEELEDHLRSRIEDLAATGLSPDEAFLVAVKRVGSLDALTREFAREHSDRLWKQLVLGGDAADPQVARGAVLQMLGLAVIAAVAVRVPELWNASDVFYALNASLLVLGPLAAWFALARGLSGRAVLAVAGLFGLGALAVNLVPYTEDSPTVLLTAIHLPIALWLVVGIAYAGGDWRSGPARMDFIRFTGEWFVYYVLIALGGIVLTAVTIGTFNAIGYEVEDFVTTWLVPCGAAGAVIVAAWLVEEKKSVIENIAPVLATVFLPLFVVVLTLLTAGLTVSGLGLEVDRDVLIIFDLVLVVVLGLLLYTISARPPGDGRRWSDPWLLALVVVTLVIDVLVLGTIAVRISEFGFSANKTAALGENLILLVNLAVSAKLLLGLLRGRTRFAALERWQTSYVVVYAAWAWVVVLAFPAVFGI